MFDPLINEAVQRLRLRAERSEVGVNPKDEGKVLAESFVDTGLLAPLDTENNQVVYGRRGTGKTHMLRYLAERHRVNKDCVCYIDCRTLGSASLFLDSTKPLVDRTLALFRDVMITLNHTILEHAGRFARTPDVAGVVDSSNDLLAALTFSMSRVQPKGFEQTLEASQSSKASIGLAIQSMLPTLQAEGGSESKHSEKVDGDFSGIDTVIFPDVGDALVRLLHAAGGRTRLWLMIDEWSSLPSDVQPALAEFLKRSMIHSPAITIKIAAIEHRSYFSRKTAVGQMGLELGSDVVVARNLDDYYNIQLNGRELIDRFSMILYRHLAAAVPEDELRKRGATSSSSTMQALCGSSAQAIQSVETFATLVDASGGNPRDFLQMLGAAYAIDYSSRGRFLSREAATTAIRSHGLLTKLGELGPSLSIEMKRLIGAVLRDQPNRYFLVPQEAERTTFLSELLDARVVHPAARAVVTADEIGTFFTKLSLDLSIVLEYQSLGVAIEDSSVSSLTYRPTVAALLT